jgi:ABC-type phosphate transport system substrate-binding protein
MSRNIQKLIYIVILCCFGFCGCKKEEVTQGIAPVTTTPTKIPEQVNTSTLNPSSIENQAMTMKTLANSIAKEDFPIIDGSTATIPISEAVYQLATGATTREAAVEIVHTKTSSAYYRLLNQEADLLIVYEPSEQVMQDIESSGVKLSIKPIGKDALVFMANKSNPVDSLTSDQIVEIYTGKRTNWKEVGGLDKDIVAFQRPDSSGSQTLMKKLVMKDNPMMTGPNVISFAEMGEILEAMAEYSNDGNTLGYSVFYYANNMYHLPELRFMKVNGIEPTLNTIFDNSYPYINEFYAVIREEESINSNARRIFDWLTETEGQAMVKELGYVPVSMDVNNHNPSVNETILDQIPEGYVYIGTNYVTGYGSYNGTVTIYQGAWEPIKVFQNAYIAGNIGLVPYDQDITIGIVTKQNRATYVMRYGQYSLINQDFILPVIYDSISVLDKKQGYYVVSNNGDSYITNEMGETIDTGSLQGDSLNVTKRGNFYWVMVYNNKTNQESYRIFDLNFKLYKEIQKVESEYELFENDGTVYFSKELFLNKMGFEENETDVFWLQNYGYDEPIIICNYNKQYYVMDRNLNLLAQKEETSETNNYYGLYQDIFCDTEYDYKTYTEMGTFYDKYGKVIKDRYGNTYSNIVNDNFWRSGSEYEQILYRFENGKLKVYNYENGDVYQIELKSWSNATVSFVYKDLIFVTNNGFNQRMRIYKGSKLIYDLDGYYYIDSINNDSSGKKGILLTQYGNEVEGNKYRMISEEGTIIYQTQKKENLINIDDKYIQLYQGNYWGVMDYQGNYIVKMIKQSMSND